MKREHLIIIPLILLAITSLIHWRNKGSKIQKIKLRRKKSKSCFANWESNSFNQGFISAEDFIMENTISYKSWELYWPTDFKVRFCFDHHNAGNRLGDLFNSLGCAELAGLNVAIDGSTWPAVPFLSSLPRIVKHDTPATSKTTAVSMVKANCMACEKYCHEDSKNPWIHALPIIRKEMHRAAVEHVKHFNQTTINRLTDFTSEPGAILPVIPTVTVQYRCGDNVENMPDRYGFIPFGAITDKIPQDAEYIYIVSDPPERSIARAAEFNSKCNDIIKALHQHVSSRFQCATVVAKRGGDLFLDFARFTLSNITICSSSTFCLWPALANRNTVYMPTSLTMGGATQSLRPDFGPNIFFLDEPMVSNFTKHTAVSDILRSLRSFHRNGVKVTSDLMHIPENPKCLMERSSSRGSRTGHSSTSNL